MASVVCIRIMVLTMGGGEEEKKEGLVQYKQLEANGVGMKSGRREKKYRHSTESANHL